MDFSMVPPFDAFDGPMRRTVHRMKRILIFGRRRLWKIRMHMAVCYVGIGARRR